MSTLRQAAQQALEALERINAIHYLQDLYEALDWEIDALRAALAEPQTTHWEGCEAVHPECKERVMDRELLIRLAREAGFIVDELSRQHQPNCINHTWHMIDEGLSRFAALVAAHEREACAQIAKQWDIDHPSTNYGGCIAAAIRSRT